MTASQITDLSKCAVHTMTNKPWSLAECCDHYAAVGMGGISVWRNIVAHEEGGIGLDEAIRIVKGSGLSVSAYVRGGFFVAADEKSQQAAISHNKTMLDEAAALGAEQLVLVVGAIPGTPLEEARKHVADGIFGCLEHAEQVGVKLSIEPLHPMYAADKSCINRIAEARQICNLLDHAMLGVAVDVYHVWWDPELGDEIRELGKAGQLFGFHVCDWRIPTRHLLTDRGLMGDGCIDIRAIRGLAEDAGFKGFNEVEIFSEHYWAMDQREYTSLIAERYLCCV